MEIIDALVLGWFIGCITFFAGFFLGALVYNKPKKKGKEE